MCKNFEITQIKKKKLNKLKKKIFKLYLEEDYFAEDVLKYFALITGQFLSQANVLSPNSIIPKTVVKVFEESFFIGWNFNKNKENIDN